MASARTWRRQLGAIGAAVIAAAVLAAAGWWIAVHWRPSPDDYPLQGIDVSEATGAIDWAIVRAGGADFAYIRATTGADRHDAAFAANWSGARAAGVRRGAWHQYDVCRSAAKQANNFMVRVPRVSDALPAAVAIDADPACAAPPARAALIGELARFARLVESHTGKLLLLRISPAIETQYGLSRALERPLWATGSYLRPDYLARPWRMWQANARRRIDGAEAPVGWDVVAP